MGGFGMIVNLFLSLVPTFELIQFWCLNITAEVCQTESILLGA